MKKGLEAKSSRFYYCDWQSKRALPLSVLCVDSGSQHIECECIFHDRARGARERDGRWIEENLCFLGVHTETAELSQEGLVCVAFCMLCDCVRVWVHNKNTMCGRTAWHQILYLKCVSCMGAAHVTVVNNMCHGEVLYKKVWWSSSHCQGLEQRRDNRIQTEVSLGLTGELQPVR